MNRCRRLLLCCASRFIFGIIVIALNSSSFSAQGEDPASKLDASLQMIYGRYDQQWKFYPTKDLPTVDPSVEALREIVAIDLSGEEPVVPVAVTVRDQGQELEINGFQIQAQIGDLVTTRVPVSRLPFLAGLRSVVYIQASRIREQLAHDVSVPETKAPQARQSFNLTGKGVIVGVIDSGIDWRHADFRKPDGSTRIKFLWDLFDKTGPEPADISGGGGSVYTEAQINAALTGAGTVREADRNGHGSHVAGSAGGNGRATGNGFPAGTYTGMAPEADLIIVKGLGDDGKGGSVGIINGLKFIDARARELNMPYVINLSLGGPTGAHDGSASEERAIDNLVGPGKPGKVVCVAAGNDGARPFHASGTVQPGAANPELVVFGVPAQQKTAVVIDLWYSGTDSFNVLIGTPTKEVTPTIKPGDEPLQMTLKDGTGIIIISTPTISLNNSKNIFIAIVPVNSNQPIPAGVWAFGLQQTAAAPGGFDAWVNQTGRIPFLDHVDPGDRLGVPGTAKNAITVGSYITKSQWTDIKGEKQSYVPWGLEFNAPVSAKSPFSGNGPTRDKRQKPEILAPGQGIASVMSADSNPDNTEIVPDGQHKIEQGTSQATPHATGAVALMLQANSKLDASQVRDALTKTARSDDFTGRVPNPNWGFGKMDVLEAVKLVGASSTPAPPPPPPNPVITSVDPNSIQQGTTVQATINGSNFTGAKVTVEITPSAGITINQAAAVSANRVNLSLTVAASAAVGNYSAVVVVDGRRSGPGIFRVVSPNTPSTDPQDPYEPNDTLQDAKPIPANGRINARIDPRTDIDIFKFPATKGRKVTFDIDAQTLTPPSQLDSIIGVFDRSGNLLASNDDDGSTFDSHLEWIPSVTDTYFILVASASTDAGPYTSGPYLLKIDGHAGDIRSDTTPPIFDAGSILVPQILSKTTELWGEWFAQDPESGIDHYEYAVGTSPGGTNVVPFTRIPNFSVFLSGLNLQNGSTYYFAVKAVNGAGLSSAVQVSRGIRIDTSFPGFPIYFPRVVALPGSFTGAAVSNPTNSVVQVLYRLFDNAGNLVLGDGITNPTTAFLGPHEQLPLLSTELFGVPTSNSPGWVEIQASDPNVKAFFLYGGSSFLDGADVTGSAMTDFMFHRVQESGDFIFTSVNIVNPNDSSANANVELWNKNGQMVSSQNITVGAKQRLVKLVRDLFPGVTQQLGGTIRVRSNLGLTGFELFGANASDIGGINPQASNDTTRSLFFGHLASQGIWYTEISATNPNDGPLQVQFRANDDHGNLIAGPGIVNPATVTIPARGQFDATASDTFHFSGSQVIEGYITAQVISGTGGIFGNIVFGTTNGRAVAALPVQTRGSGNFVFSQIAQVGSLFTGVTLLDPDTNPANVKTEAFNANGLSLGSRKEVFQPSEKKARIISDIVSGSVGQTDGYIQVTSDRPMVGFELFGSTDLAFLAAVPPQALTGGTGKESNSGLIEPANTPRHGVSKGQTGDNASGKSLYQQLYRRLIAKQPAANPRDGWMR